MSTVKLPDGREMDKAEYDKALALLIKPFEQNEIEKKPQQMKTKDDDKGKCERGSRYSADGYHCGGWHARSLHLDYIGHAGITDRLNQVDPMWTWEPMGLTPQGTPLVSDGGMWGRLTVLGVTRIGFGDPGRNTGANAVKEMIGDFLRNAAMRFGVATYLWSKSEAAMEKKLAEEPQDNPPANTSPKPAPRAAAQMSGTNWTQLFEAAAGDVKKLEALRNQGRQAGAPEAMFPAIDKRIAELTAETPIEGVVQQ